MPYIKAYLLKGRTCPPSKNTHDLDQFIPIFYNLNTKVVWDPRHIWGSLKHGTRAHQSEQLADMWSAFHFLFKIYKQYIFTTTHFLLKNIYQHFIFPFFKIYKHIYFTSFCFLFKIYKHIYIYQHFTSPFNIYKHIYSPAFCFSFQNI